MQNYRTNLVLPSGAKQEAANQAREGSIVPQAQLVDDIDCDRCIRRCGPRYYLEKPANSRMDAARDHVHQLHRRSVSKNAEEFDFTAYHIQPGLGNRIP